VIGRSFVDISSSEAAHFSAAAGGAGGMVTTQLAWSFAGAQVTVRSALGGSRRNEIGRGRNQIAWPIFAPASFFSPCHGISPLLEGKIIKPSRNRTNFQWASSVRNAILMPAQFPDSGAARCSFRHRMIDGPNHWIERESHAEAERRECWRIRGAFE